MKIIRASKAGFCMGVSLALKKLENAIERQKKLNKPVQRICTLGPIIHNPQVLEYFKSQGVCCLKDTLEAKEDDFVLIRAHGIPAKQEDYLRQICHFVEDATCPKVKKAQLSIAKATANGETLLLFGEKEHPEVCGLMSYAKGDTFVFDSLAKLNEFSLEKTMPYVLASQTTQDRECFVKIAQFLENKTNTLNVLSTICNATKERQEEAIRIASIVDMVIVAGGKNSGNTRRLASLSKQACSRVIHVESANELPLEELKKCKSAGIIAGASTPGKIIDEIENCLLSYIQDGCRHN